MDILNLALPLVGVIGAFLLAIAAIKQRTLLAFFGRGLDQTKALSQLPDRKKLEGLEIIENTLKIETIGTEKLNAEQTYSLILETLREKKRTATYKFVVYTAFSLFILICVGSFMYYKMFYDPESKISDALTEDEDSAQKILNRLYYYKKTDPNLVEELAKETEFGPPGENAYRRLEDKLCINKSSKTCNEAISEMRVRAEKGEPPFNDVGLRITVGVPSGDEEPFRYTANVSGDFQYAKRVIIVMYKGRRLTLYAAPKMGVYPPCIRRTDRVYNEA